MTSFLAGVLHFQSTKTLPVDGLYPESVFSLAMFSVETSTFKAEDAESVFVARYEKLSQGRGRFRQFLRPPLTQGSVFP